MWTQGVDAPSGRSLELPERKGSPTEAKPDALGATIIGAEAGVAFKDGAGLSFLEQVGDCVIEAADIADPTFVFSTARLAFDGTFEKPTPDSKRGA